MGSGAQPPQLLADGEVSMAFAFNGRIFNAAQGEGKPFKIVWDGQIYEMEGWPCSRARRIWMPPATSSPSSTAPEQQARAAEFISYGPPRKSAAAMVGNIEGTDVPMGPNLLTFADNMKQALGSNQEFLGRPRRRTGRAFQRLAGGEDMPRSPAAAKWPARARRRP